MKRTDNIIVAILMLFSFSSNGYTQEAQQSQQEEEGTATVVETKPGNVTLDFKDAEIQNVLRILSYKSGVNIIADKDVTGVVTIRLVDVPWETALDVILRTYGFAYEREGNIIRVTTIENLEKEELVTEVFTLNYAKAKDIPVSINEILTARGKVKFDERTNTIIVSDIPTNMYKIRKVIENLDKPTPQVSIEAKVIETTLDKDENLGIDWTTSVTVTGSKRPTTAPFARKDDGGAVFPLGDPSSSAGTTVGSFLPNPGTAFPEAVPANFTFGTLDFAQFKAVLEVLDSRKNTKIISNPRITTLNNQKANIIIGETLNIPTYERNPTTGSMEITGYTEKSLGIKLEVTPHINEQGDIVIDLKPEVTALLSFDDYGNIKAPRISTREATTQVMIKDGQTIAIGGLMKENKIDLKKKVPLLGDIPVAGWLLFRKTEQAIDTTDLLFFITVNLIKPEKT